MRIARTGHSWSLTPQEAVAVQRRLVSQVSSMPPDHPIRFVAGLDAAFSRDGAICIGAVVLWDRLEQRVLEQRLARRPLTFPYIPGLLSFREIPALLGALRKLRQPPDVLMCDGQGVAHPRRFGIASHLGVICELPSIGCAKSRLIGEHGDVAWERGARAPLTDQGELIGVVLRTQTGIRPLYVSRGHRMDLPTAEQIVWSCALRYRLPEPTRLADRAVAQAKRGQ